LPDLVARGLSEATLVKLRKRKELEGFGDRDWAAWLTFLARDQRIEETFRERIQRETAKFLLSTWMENFAENLPEIRRKGSKTIADLVPNRPNLDEPEGSAVVIGRGPSVFKRGHLRMLAESDYRGTVICTDGILRDALKAGVTPDKYRDFLVVTVDGNRERIVKWYDDPVVDGHGRGIKACLSTTVAHNVYERCRRAGIEVYWFHPLFDDYRSNESFSRLMKLMTQTEEHPRGVPSVSALGNTGSCSWVISHALLRHSPTCLIGIDFGYPEGTPLEETHYFSSLCGATKGDMRAVQSAYREVVNPNGERAITDLVFYHYREAFLEAAREVNPKFETWNCFPGETPVCGNDSIKEIRNIEMGSTVLTDHGLSHVKRLFRRPYSGPMIRIRVLGDLPVLMTPDHPVRAFPAKIKIGRDGRMHHDGRFMKKLGKFGEKMFIWCQAQELRRGDFVARPIDLTTSDIQEINNPLCRLIGYYLAEGCLEKFRVIFSFGTHEKNYITDLISLLKKMRSKPSLRTQGSAVHIRVASKKMVDFFSQFGRKSTEKHIPGWAMHLPVEKQAEIVKGYWRGDGDIGKGSFRATSVSLPLLRGIKEILLRMGIFSSIYVGKNNPSSIDGRQLREGKVFSIRVGGVGLNKLGKILGIEHPWLNKRSCTYMHHRLVDGWLLVPITSCERVEYSGDVFNLSVEGRENYVVPNLGLVHNCTESGTLFSNDGTVKWKTFREFLEKFKE